MSRKRMKKGKAQFPLKNPKVMGILVIAIIGIAGFAFYGNDMIGYASKVLDFLNPDGEDAGDGAMSASMGVYDKDGNLIRKESSFMSGFMLEEQEVSYIEFTISTKVTGLNVNWSTLSMSWNLAAYPNGYDEISSLDKHFLRYGSVLIFSNGTEYPASYLSIFADSITDDGCTIKHVFTIWDYDWYVESDYYNTGVTENTHVFLEEALGDPVAYDNVTGESAYLLQLVYDVSFWMQDVNGNPLSAGAYVTATWQLLRLEGQLAITLNDEVTIEDIDPELQRVLDRDDLEKVIHYEEPYIGIGDKGDIPEL